jgi:hypothetical protein
MARVPKLGQPPRPATIGPAGSANGRTGLEVVAPSYRRHPYSLRRLFHRQLFPFLLLLPAVVLVGLFIGYPIVKL